MMRGRSVNRYFSIIGGPAGCLDSPLPGGEIAAGDRNRKAGRRQHREQHRHVPRRPLGPPLAQPPARDPDELLAAHEMAEGVIRVRGMRQRGSQVGLRVSIAVGGQDSLRDQQQPPVVGSQNAGGLPWVVEVDE